MASVATDIDVAGLIERDLSVRVRGESAPHHRGAPRWRRTARQSHRLVRRERHDRRAARQPRDLLSPAKLSCDRRGRVNTARRAAAPTSAAP